MIAPATREEMLAADALQLLQSWCRKALLQSDEKRRPTAARGFRQGGREALERAIKAPRASPDASGPREGMMPSGAGVALPYLPPKVMRRMTSWPSIQRCLKVAATWPTATASIP